MKKLILGVILFVLSMELCAADTAATTINVSSAVPSLKIGVVNTKDIENSLYGKEIYKKLEKEFNPRKDKFDEKQKELQSKGDLLQRDRAVLSDKERTSKEREVMKLQQEIQHLSETLDTEFKSRYQEELLAFNKIIDNVVTKIANREKYDLILPDRIVMFSNDHLDCTAKIVSELDAQFKAKK